jgi:glycerol-3-phosphate acyltransferase PlsY
MVFANILETSVGLTIGYLLGSIPCGLILTHLCGYGDVRSIGSGNIGATNVLRTGRKDLAILTLLLDGAKGAVAILFVKAFFSSSVGFAALGAFVGDVFPLWL